MFKGDISTREEQKWWNLERERSRSSRLQCWNLIKCSSFIFALTSNVIVSGLVELHWLHFDPEIRLVILSLNNREN